MKHSDTCATSYPHGGTLGFAKVCTDGSHVVSTVRCVTWVADISGITCRHIVRTHIDVNHDVRFKDIQPVPFLSTQNYPKILMLLHFCTEQ
jgi:hypothetical protein